MNGFLGPCFPVALIAVVIFLIAGSGFCEAPPLFTNADIDKYRSSSDTRLQEQKDIAPGVKRDEHRKARDEGKQEYWCKRATVAGKNIEKAERNVRQQEEEISKERSKTVRTSKKIDALQNRLRKAKESLASAEEDLNDIENEAHRRGIRPGWLRCQFD